MKKEFLLTSIAKLVMVVSLIVGIGAVVGLMGYLEMMSKNGISIDETITEEIIIQDETSDWKTYEWEQLKFKYPRTWKVEDIYYSTPYQMAQKESPEKIGLRLFPIKGEKMNDFIAIGGKQISCDSSEGHARCNYISEIENYIYTDSNNNEVFQIFDKIISTLEFIKKDEITDWKQYENFESKFSIRVPLDFNVFLNINPLDSPNYDELISNFFIKNDDNIHNAILVRVETWTSYFNSSTMSDESPSLGWIDFDIERSDSSYYSGFKKEDFILDNNPAIKVSKFAKNLTEKSITIYTINENRMYKIDTIIDVDQQNYYLPILEQILSTFKFIEKDEVVTNQLLLGDLKFILPNDWKIKTKSNSGLNVEIITADELQLDFTLEKLKSYNEFGSGKYNTVDTGYGQFWNGISNESNLLFGISFDTGQYYNLLVDFGGQKIVSGDNVKIINMIKSAELFNETADWKTYRNEEYGFEVKYPEDYYYEQGAYMSNEKYRKYWVRFANFKWKDQLVHNPSFIIDTIKTDLSLKEYLDETGDKGSIMDETCQKDKTYCLLKNEKDFYINSIKTPVLRFSSAAVSGSDDHVLVKGEEYIIDLRRHSSGIGEFSNDTFSQILSTFKLIEK